MKLRWIALCVTVLNVLFNAFYQQWFGLVSVAQVSDAYPSAMSPAGYTFSIWGLIYLTFIIYSTVQVLPSFRKEPVYDVLAGPLLILNICCSAWLVLFTQNWIGLSLFLLFLTAVLAYRAFRLAYLAVHYRNYNLWLQFPFSLFAGWITVAVAANFTIYLRHLGLHLAIGDENLAIVLIVMLSVLSYTISVRSYSLVFPAAVAWGLIGVSVARRPEIPALANVALLSALVLLVGVFIAGLFRKFRINKSLEKQLEF